MRILIPAVIGIIVGPTLFIAAVGEPPVASRVTLTVSALMGLAAIGITSLVLKRR